MIYLYPYVSQGPGFAFINSQMQQNTAISIAVSLIFYQGSLRMKGCIYQGDHRRWKRWKRWERWKNGPFLKIGWKRWKLISYFDNLDGKDGKIF